MTPYSIEIFDRELKCKFHDSSDAIEIDEDYISPDSSTVIVRRTNNVAASDFIHISGAVDFFGIVTNATDYLYYSEITFRPFITLFDHNCLVDTDWQADPTVSLENVIKTLIENYWVNASGDDGPQTFLNITCATQTTEWGLNLKSDVENMHMCIVGLYKVVITKALTKYGIAIEVVPDFQNGRVNLIIGKRSENLAIEADLPSVTIDTFSIHKYNGSVNKLQIFNTENYNEIIYYYLHTNGRYDTDGTSDRVYPVVWEVRDATPEHIEGYEKTFAQVASAVASNAFSGSEWQDEVELIVDQNDTLIKPNELKIGQGVDIIHEGVVYPSIYTGRKLGAQITLIFGTVRTDLTKILKVED